MTDVTITIGGNNVSNDTFDVDTWRDRLTSIGRCRIMLDNSADVWGNTFAPNDAIVISVIGTIIWQGFVDDVKPYLPAEGVIDNKMVVTGRDHGRYLTDFYFTKKYKDQLSGAIIDDILSDMGDPLLYTDPGGTPSIKYEGARTTLGDALRDICELTGYDFYIDNTGRMHFIVAGSVDSTVDLDMVAGLATNNVLTFEEYEEVGFSIKNYIEIHAGSVKDHYTDNKGGWSVGGGGAVDDSDVQRIYGTKSIELTSTGAASRIYLDFSGGLYGYDPVIDLSKPSEAKVFIKGERASANSFSFRPYLIDSSARKITFTRRGPELFGSKGTSKGWTEGIIDWNVRNVWTALSYSLGASDGNPIKPVGTTGYWSGNAAFDWSHVEIMGFEFPHTNNGIVWIDGWSIPSLEAKAIAEDAGVGSSQALYGKRMFTEYRKELRSQKQLEDYAAAVLALRKDPIQKFKCVAKGQVLTKYAAQTVDVNVPAYGLNDVPYTITALHHKVHHDWDVRGWDFVTEYELVEQDAPAYRVIRDDNPMEVLMDRLRRENRGFKGGMGADDILLGDVISGDYVDATTGATFPTDPANGDYHFLTADYNDGVNQYYGKADGVLYQYDETSGTWKRGPITMHRAAQPPAGGEVDGDEWYDTTNNIKYRWDAGVPGWVQISSLNIVDTPDFGTIEWPSDQLEIAVRPWTSDVNIIWDEANLDWDEFWWGQIGDEKNTNAGLAFADGTARVITKGTNATLGNGTWYVYWDENLDPGGPYTLRWTQNYPTASGVDKGLVAIVECRIAAGESPSIIMINSYTPTIGAGALTTHSIFSKHITAGAITAATIAVNAVSYYKLDGDMQVTIGPSLFRYFLEGENPVLERQAGTTIVNDTTASGGQCIRRLSIAASDTMWYGPYEDDLPGGNYWALYRMKVTSNASTLKVIKIDVAKPGIVVLGSRELTPSDFETSGKWSVFAVPCRIEDDDTRIEIRGMEFVTGITDVFMDWVSLVPMAKISSDCIEATWITGKKFRTAEDVGVGGGPAGIRFDANEIAGYSGGVTKTFYLQSANGKAYCGAGAVILDTAGITVNGQAIFYNDAGEVLRGWLYGIGGGNPYFQLAANNADLKLTTGAGKFIELLPAGNSIKFNPAGNIVFANNFDAIVPTTAGNLDLGTAVLKIGNIHSNLIKAYVNLRIPAVGADPAALINGDLWLRTDL